MIGRTEEEKEKYKNASKEVKLNVQINNEINKLKIVSAASEPKLFSSVIQCHN